MGNSIFNKGDRYGRLLLTGNTKMDCRLIVETICECGNIGWKTFNSLKTGKSKSCGCLRRESLLKANIKHNYGGKRIGHIWYNMIRRCNNNKCAEYKRYGGRGIKVCEERMDIDIFMVDMLDSYNDHVSRFGEKNTTLDRIDTNGDYCNSNCKRSTRKQQSRNTRRNTKVSIFGRYILLTDACFLLGTSYNTIRHKKYKSDTSFQYLVDEIIAKLSSDEYNAIIQKIIESDDLIF